MLKSKREFKKILKGYAGIEPKVEFDDYDTFSEYVIMLLKDVELRKRISRNALALAKKFDHWHAAEKLERVLLESKEAI